MELLPVIMSDTTSHLKHKVIEKKIGFEYLSVYVRTQPAIPTNRYSKARAAWTLEEIQGFLIGFVW